MSTARKRSAMIADGDFFSRPNPDCIKLSTRRALPNALDGLAPTHSFQRTICCIAKMVFSKNFINVPLLCQIPQVQKTRDREGKLLEDPLMIKPQSETRTSPLDAKTTRAERFVRAQRFGRSFCPKCKDMLLAPMMSEYVNEALVRHLWSCDMCGYEFQTAVRLTKVSASPRGNTLS